MDWGTALWVRLFLHTFAFIRHCHRSALKCFKCVIESWFADEPGGGEGLCRYNKRVFLLCDSKTGELEQCGEEDHAVGFPLSHFI